MSYKPSPSMIIAMLALIVALGGAALAAGVPFLLGQANSATTRTSLASNGTTQTLSLNNNSGAAALGLSVKTGHPPMTVSSKGLVTNLNADLVGGLHADELMRLGVSSAGNRGSTAVFTPQATVTLQIPTDRFVLVTGQAWGTITSSSCAPCYMHMLFRDTTATTISPVILTSIGFGTANEVITALSGSWVFPVTAGERTFVLETAPVPTALSLAVSNPGIAALFVPFGGDGTAATNAQPAQGDQPAPIRFGPVRHDGTRTIIR